MRQERKMKKVLLVLATLSLLSAVASEPVWPEGLRDEMNVLVEFEGSFDYSEGPVVLDFSAASIARVKVNGSFAAYGPARPPKGFARWDRWDLTRFARKGGNRITIEVAGYNVGTFYLQKLPPFLDARLSVAGKTVVETFARPGPSAFVARRRLDRWQRVTRIGYQRGPCDAWKLPESRGEPLRLARTESLPRLARGVPYPVFKIDESFRPKRRETIERREDGVKYVDRAITSIARETGYDGFPDGTYEVDLLRERQRYAVVGERQLAPAARYRIASDTAVVFEGKVNTTGFWGFRFDCRRPGRVIVTCDECEGRPQDYWINFSVDFTEPGTYAFETFEPYVAKVVRIYAVDAEGDVIGAPWVREYKNPEPFGATFRSSDPLLDRVFTAAQESLAQNTLDTLTDCPGRERGGWLCDSTFTGEASSYVDAKASVEKVFFEDWARAVELPEAEAPAMLPPLYPADTAARYTIRNWPVWLVVHAAQYARRTGDRMWIDALKPRLLPLADYLMSKYRDPKTGYATFGGIVAYPNATSAPQGSPNFAVNMLWAQALGDLGEFFGRADFAAEAQRLRGRIAAEAWNGTWFQASAKKDDVTEALQTYAFYFGFATPQSHPELWRRYVDELGPARTVDGARGESGLWRHGKAVRYTDIFPAGPIRLQLLSRAGETQAFFRDAKGYFGHMAETTGTLWEYCASSGSLCHGFPTLVLPLIHAEALGIRRIDRGAKKVFLAKPVKSPLLFAEGELPLEGGVLKVKWRRTGEETDWSYVLPDGWDACPL